VDIYLAEKPYELIVAAKEIIYFYLLPIRFGAFVIDIRKVVTIFKSEIFYKRYAQRNFYGNKLLLPSERLIPYCRYKIQYIKIYMIIS
jgi:hypothetical protein